MRICLIIILNLIYVFSQGQEIIQNDAGSKSYKVNNSVVNYYDLEDYFYKYSASGNAYDSYRFYNRNAKRFALAGAITLTLGFVLFATDGGDCCTGQQGSGLVLALISIPLEITALTFYIISLAKKDRPIEIYNEIESKQIGARDEYKLGLNFNANKVGLILTF